MADINLTQAKANALLAMEKYCVDNTRVGLSWTRRINSIAKDERKDFSPTAILDALLPKLLSGEIV